jgi:hypothetical protein
MEAPSHRIGLARVFFRYDAENRPTHAVIHTLKSHGANVRAIMGAFQPVDHELQPWKEDLLRAAELHD